MTPYSISLWPVIWHHITLTYLSRLPWIFPEAPLKISGASRNIQGNLIDMYSCGITVMKQAINSFSTLKRCCISHAYRQALMIYRADSRFVPSQRETALLCNNVSHWLGPSLGSVLIYMMGSLEEKKGEKHNCVVMVPGFIDQFCYELCNCGNSQVPKSITSKPSNHADD